MSVQDQRFPCPRFTRLGLLVGIPLAIAVGARTVAWAVPDPAPFNTGDKLSSAELNANFKTLTTAVSALEAKLVPSEIIVSDTFGPGVEAFGSTDNRIYRFKTVVVSTGTAITRDSSAANGDSFTIHEDGVYAIQHKSISPAFGATGGGTTLGFSVNALPAERVTDIYSIDASHQLNIQSFAVPLNGRTYPSLTGVYQLKAGDIVRAQGVNGDFCEGAAPYPRIGFRITKVASL